MSDWQDATDPVPRRELTETERKRLQALMELRRRQGFRWLGRTDTSPVYLVHPDFDDMGA